MQFDPVLLLSGPAGAWVGCGFVGGCQRCSGGATPAYAYALLILAGRTAAVRRMLSASSGKNELPLFRRKCEI